MCSSDLNQEEHMKFVREEGFRQGHEQGIEQGIRNLMKNMGWSEREAMKALGIPEGKWEEYEEKIKEDQR